VLRALSLGGNDLTLKRWAGHALMTFPGHFQDGFGLLRSILEANPNDPQALEDFIAGLKRADETSPTDFAWMKRWLEVNPEDLRILELFGDSLIKLGRDDEYALTILRRAAQASARRTHYLKAIGRIHAKRNDWSNVIATFDQILTDGHDSEEVVMALATAYAEFDRADDAAAEVYGLAMEMGSRSERVHNSYCRFLYEKGMSHPEAVAQFTESATLFPNSRWAKLGVGRHLLAAGDAGRALDSALLLLSRDAADEAAVKLAGKALAGDFSRRQLSRLGSLADALLVRIFEAAHLEAPEAGPISLGLVRLRLAANAKDSHTLKLLADVCRQNPEALDLRLSRADLLWSIGQIRNAVELYRELLSRWRALDPKSAAPRGLQPDDRKRILNRMAEGLLKQGDAVASDAPLLIEAALEPGAPRDIVVKTGRLLAEMPGDSMGRADVLQKAINLEPGNMRIERALADATARMGRPERGVRLAIRFMRDDATHEEAARLLRTVEMSSRTASLPEALTSELRTALSVAPLPPASVLLPALELLLSSQTPSPADYAMLQSVADQFPRNMKVKRWLAHCLSARGDDAEASELYGQLVSHTPSNDELLLELAAAHARMGRKDREALRVATQAIAIDPENTALILHLAEVELAGGAAATAARRLMRLMAKQPDCHAEVLHMVERHDSGATEPGPMAVVLARAHGLAGHVEQALLALGRMQPNYRQNDAELIEAYSDLIAIDPTNSRTFVERGIQHRLCGRLDEALADLQTAYDFNGNDQEAQAELADTLAMKLNEGGVPDAAMCLRASVLFMQLGDEKGALNFIEAALDAHPEDEHALQLLARIQLNSGQLQNCWATVQKLKSRDLALGLLQELARAFAEGNNHLMAAEVLGHAIAFAGPEKDLLVQLRKMHETQARSAESAPARARIMGALGDVAKDRYELREEIGSGSMGIVYKAYDRELDELVALKILPEHFAQDNAARTSFKTEAKAARKLAHPNIVRIHDIGEAGGRLHISMEFVSGGDLKAHIANHRRGIPTDDAIRIIKETARGLAHAHGEGVLHRDIKAANILLSGSGRVKITDFGISSFLDMPSSKTDSTTNIEGTPLYMSPEQFEHGPLSPASDLYSLGIVFYELLCGAPPFVRGSISYHHQFTMPVKPEVVPEPVWEVLSKVLAKRPEDRYQKAEELLRALDFGDGRH